LEYDKGKFELNTFTNLVRKETATEKSISSYADIKFKLNYGHRFNLRIRPHKAFVQYDFGVYQVQQEKTIYVNPYVFHLNDLVNKKKVFGLGAITDVSDNLKINVK